MTEESVLELKNIATKYTAESYMARKDLSFKQKLL